MEGELLTITDPRLNVTTLTYTTAGLIASVKDAQIQLTQFQYDAHGNRTSMTDPQTAATTYVYDTLNRLTSLASPQGTFGFNYDVLSRRTQLTRPNNVATTYAYDPLSRLQSVLHQLAASTIDGATYTVDAAGNRTSKTDRLANVTSNYAYDALYQLTGVTQGASTTESYTYDSVGNRLTSANGSSTYNASNEITASPTATFTYDNNGNTVSKTDSTGATNYTWDFENRLASVTLPGAGGTVTFKYDPFGRRIQKSSGSGTTNYLLDADNVLEEVDTAGNLLTRYTQGLGIDEPLAMLRSGATSFYHADGLGSITSLSNATGAIAQTYTFDSFGKQTASSGSLTNPFQYTAREFDSETGLYFYRARHYDPQAGRFINEDPLRFELGAADFYIYVSNNPLGYSDPLGLSAADVQRILSQAQNILDQMTKNGERINNGNLNNILSSLQRLNPLRKKPPLKGCGEQADKIASDLQFPNKPYEDHWTIGVITVKAGVIPIFFHQIAVAHSDNPNDPDIIIDPWNNKMFKVPQVKLP